MAETKSLEWLHLPHLFLNYLFLRGCQLIVLFIHPLYPGHLADRLLQHWLHSFMFPVMLPCPISTLNGLVCSHHTHLQPQFPLSKAWLRQEDALKLVFYFLCFSFEHSPVSPAVKAIIFMHQESCARAPFGRNQGDWFPATWNLKKGQGESFHKKITQGIFINHLIISI